ncbi:prepilin-type N-terminal cleavage/methylation domain-containing protein [Parelusimicrobium proximum]|uniref:type IV pilin protein n=1 Tax=Parelusimicrobium proximum TaxID=3228953 RepID=UPI003D185D7C
MNRKAFTLIELLVVVLIIAVLAAVALPQYTAAVEKSRAAETLITVRAMRDAQDRYFLQHDEYATKFAQLDIIMPKGTSSSCTFGGCTDAIQTPTWKYELYAHGWHSYNKDKHFSIVFYNDLLGKIDPPMAGLNNSLSCTYNMSSPKKDFYKKMCEVLGGELKYELYGWARYKLS